MLLRQLRIALTGAGVSIALVSAYPAGLEAQLDWRKQWENTVELAKKEGEIQVYGPHDPIYLPIWGKFQSVYPQIKFKFVPGRGADLAQRISAERRAEKYLVDLLMGGPTISVSLPPGTFAPIQPLVILPEVKDESAWWGRRLSFADPERRFVAILLGGVGRNRVAYNTKLVDPKEIQSWWDLLKPNWKGKIAGFDPRAPGGGAETFFVFFYHTPDLGPQFIFRLFSEMNIRLTRELQQGINWLAAGTAELYLGLTGVSRAIEQGLPVSVLPHPLKEGEIMGGGACCLAVLSRNPHPNATAVFINWNLSKEGMMTWQKQTQINVLRMDIPKDDLPRTWVPQQGVSYFQAGLPQYNNPEVLKAIRKIVDEALKAPR